MSLSVRTTIYFLPSNPHIHQVRQNMVNPIIVNWLCYLGYSSPYLGRERQRDFPLAVKDVEQNKGLLCNLACVLLHTV